ncbi:MoaF C-terminal domain-containing protein [Rhodococcus erythropolis]|uniref:MoaF C-terminal domain-containing protein n=1 Tax=Rhodococcus erythropolis TaxID=1833 RepID=UPI0008791F76|nr:MoaF C-terminal domain-containing protein [Rhodococcus erythropolis]OFV78622.1 molybdenum cofactor biosynthesis protein F [Rhodococcus erythropolis]
MKTATTPFSWSKEDWAPLTEMADGFDEYLQPLSTALDGQEIVVQAHYVDGRGSLTLSHTFSASAVEWSVTENGVETAHGSDSYELFEMQPGLFYLHYLRAGDDHPVVLSAAIDTASGQVTGAIGELGLDPNPAAARQDWFQGQIVGSGATPESAHATTDELIGRRVRYAYSSNDVYDHVYLNENIFTWLCVGGTELGVGDTESCTYYKLRENTYLFSWLEKNLGVEGMVLIDLAAHRTVGIQFALDQYSGELINLTMGSYAQEFERTPGIGDALPGPADK